MKHVLSGSYIITYNWRGYDWLDDDAYGYHYVKHNHSEGSFGYGIFSTYFIENTKTNLKDKIKRIYHQIPNKNKNKDYKLKDLFEIFE